MITFRRKSPRCFGCFRFSKLSKLEKCQGCQFVSYCSKECQELDRKAHGHWCDIIIDNRSHLQNFQKKNYYSRICELEMVNIMSYFAAIGDCYVLYEKLFEMSVEYLRTSRILLIPERIVDCYKVSHIEMDFYMPDHTYCFVSLNKFRQFCRFLVLPSKYQQKLLLNDPVVGHPS